MIEVMKANVPEKIYRTTTYLDNDKGKTLWKTKPVVGAENIEYTRTDAFIEKAAVWIANRYQSNGSCLDANDIDDFEKYMKGE